MEDNREVCAEKHGEEETVVEETREDAILGGTKALITILKLSIGPFFSQVTNSMYGLINTLWVTSYVGPLGATALSSSTVLDSLSVSIGIYFSTCAISKIASLHGEKRSDLAAQIIVDLIRFSLIFALLMPAILIPLSVPLMKWFGAEKNVTDLGKEYLIPIFSCSFVTFIYLLLCGSLQAEGRTIIFAVAQVSSLVLSAGVFSPLFLIPLKVGISGVSYSLICSQLIPGIIIFICYFSGKFTAKPTFRMFINKFSPEVWETLKIGIPSLISAVACTIPAIIFIKFLGNSSSSTYEFNTMMTLYNAYNRIYQIMIALFMAITSGFLPAASFAFSAKRYRRVLFLLIHTSWIVFSIAILFSVVICTAYKPIASLFSDDPFFIQRFKDCLYTNWVTCVLAATQYLSTPLLQATQHTTMAFIVSFTTLLFMWPMASVVLYYTNKHNTSRLFYSVTINDVCSFIFLLPFTIYSIKEISCTVEEKKNKEEEEFNEL